MKNIKPVTDSKPVISVTPIRRNSVPKKIINEIKMLIDSGQLVAGSKLPPERDLAEMLQVSRPSLREALGALSLLGIIEHSPGQGTFLAASSSSWPSEPFSILFSIKRSALLDIFEARKSLEGTAAALAAVRRSDADLEVMETALNAMKRNLNVFQKYDQHEMEFHEALVASSGNEVIAELMDKLYRLLKEARQGLNGGKLKKDRAEDYQKHVVIFDNIKAGDEAGASLAMVDHLASFEERLKKKHSEEREIG